MTPDDVTWNDSVLWLVLGRLVTVLMLPWMVWVSLTIVSMQREIAMLQERTAANPPAWVSEQLHTLDSRVRILESQPRGGSDDD